MALSKIEVIEDIVLVQDQRHIECGNERRVQCRLFDIPIHKELVLAPCDIQGGDIRGANRTTLDFLNNLYARKRIARLGFRPHMEPVLFLLFFQFGHIHHIGLEVMPELQGVVIRIHEILPQVHATAFRSAFCVLQVNRFRRYLGAYIRFAQGDPVRLQVKRIVLRRNILQEGRTQFLEYRRRHSTIWREPFFQASLRTVQHRESRAFFAFQGIHDQGVRILGNKHRIVTRIGVERDCIGNGFYDRIHMQVIKILFATPYDCAYGAIHVEHLVGIEFHVPFQYGMLVRGIFMQRIQDFARVHKFRRVERLGRGAYRQ